MSEADTTTQKVKSKQELLADIDVTYVDLYVFKDSKEKQKWEDLLEKATDAVERGDNVHAQILIDRVKTVIDKLWKRIFRWHDIQKLVTKIFAIAIPIELVAICFYVYFVDMSVFPLYTSMLFGLLGGSLGVALNIGEDLQVGQSNRLQMLRLLMRPFIGVISAIVLFALLCTGLLVVAPEANQTGVLILLSIFAGFSERFIVRAMSNYMPIMNKS